MQAVILAAGKSTRTYPLTLTRPKPLLKVANKAILGYNLEALKNTADEIIVVVGYKKSMLEDFVKKNYNGLNIKFAEQKEQLGTGHAVTVLEDNIKNEFILMLGDNIYSESDVRNISGRKYSILVKKTKDWQNFGVVKEEKNIVTDIIEKPEEFVSDLVSCGLFLLDRKIFELLKNVRKSERNEYELTDALKKLALEGSLHCVKSTSCFQISFPWDLLAADMSMRGGKNAIGKNSEIHGDVVNSSIGNNCILKGDVKNSIIMDGATIDKGSVVEDSIIGENVKFSGKIIAGDDIYSSVKDKKIKAGRLGAIIGDNVEAKGVVIHPGSKIWPDRKIKGDIKEDVR